ncbi:nuclear transport factor 2 family protein [Actinomadura decatromicini]|uniref:Nuclear transport factor 2 family protein n=1 Tax=Actinomadura decatromicini TaxID=2604572 RepID=A0A5D3FP09_9ACTN|nr:nuclear transport factor 2 family protein [Actinomadura decatromicini]TYK49400.1 nuclear transport factor 2 family protein [Actinomadura decatromicini]
MTVSGTFRTAVEAKDLAAIAGALDPGIEFLSPVMVKPYLGRDSVMALLGVLLEVFEEFRYTDELVSRPPDVPAQALVFSARVAGKAVQGLDLLRFGEDGLVTGLTVMVRPLPAAMTLARVVGRRMEESSGEANTEANGAEASGTGGSGGTGGTSGLPATEQAQP